MRRVLLIDGAGAEDASVAVGAARIDLFGPVSRSDAAQLAVHGAAGIDDVVVGRPLAEPEMVALSCALRDASVRIYALDGGPGSDRNRIAPPQAGRYLAYRRAAITPLAAHLKRAFDMVFGATLVVLLAPLFALISVAIKLASPGPVFFAQPRVGLRRTFQVLKFRTMRVGAHLEHEALIKAHGNMFKLKRDPRHTRVGRLLRRFSLDELPQLFHVVTGRMSLIGPRPPMPEEVSRYTPAELRRLGTRPGLTGLWQVSGRSDLPFERCVALDAEYIERWSTRLELSIFVRTFRAVLGGRGAY